MVHKTEFLENWAHTQKYDNLHKWNTKKLFFITPQDQQNPWSLLTEVFLSFFLFFLEEENTLVVDFLYSNFHLLCKYQFNSRAGLFFENCREFFP